MTFDPKRWPRRGRELADRETLRWLEYVEWVFRCPIGWAYAAEREHSGAWHSHALIAGLGSRKWTAPRATWEERCGFIEVKSVWDGHGIAEYITKSVEWGGEVVLSDSLGRYRGALAAAGSLALPEPAVLSGAGEPAATSLSRDGQADTPGKRKRQ